MQSISGQALAIAAEGAGLVIRFEAAVAGGIPVVKALTEGLAGNEITRVMGVMNGVRAFVPRIRKHGQGGHIVNTASISGLTAIPGIGIYSTTKYAVVAISEALSVELADDDIGVSVLCPGGVDTKINDAGRNRPNIFGGPQASALPPVSEEVEDGTFEAELGELLQPDQVAELVFTAVRNGELYVFTHPAWKAPFHMRAESILEAYDKAAERRS